MKFHVSEFRFPGNQDRHPDLNLPQLQRPQVPETDRSVSIDVLTMPQMIPARAGRKGYPRKCRNSRPPGKP